MFVGRLCPLLDDRALGDPRGVASTTARAVGEGRGGAWRSRSFALVARTGVTFVQTIPGVGRCRRLGTVVERAVVVAVPSVLGAVGQPELS